MSNHSDTLPKSYRRALVIVVLLVVAYVFVWRPLFQDRDAPAQRSGATTGYVVEDGKMAWRPMSGVDKFVVNVLTLGLAANSETVNGRTLDTADIESFRVIAGRYGLDRTRVWLEGRQIVGADPATFAVLERGFAHDAFQVWKGGTQVMSLPAGETPLIEIHSDHILSIGEETWFASIPAFELPERPVTEPHHYCRHWLKMNGAIWEGATRLYDLDAADPVEMLDCDTRVSTQFKDGVGTEDLSANAGLLIRQGPDITRLTLLHDVVDVMTFPEPIEQAGFVGSGIGRDAVYLARGRSGQVYATRLTKSSPIQPIGTFAALPSDDDMIFDDAFWMGADYFTVVPAEAVTDAHVVNQGSGIRVGRYAHVGGALFNRNEILAHPGDLPVRFLGEDTVLIGSTCMDFGEFVTDVIDPTADEREVRDNCSTMRRPETVLYDGLRIAFWPRLLPIGFTETDPVMEILDIGSLAITNVSDAPIDLSPEFLAGFYLRINRTEITRPDDAWPDGGLRLEAGASHTWTYNVHTNADPTYWAWTLKMVHNVERSKIFDSDPFYIATGQFVGGN
ncbi:DKNYY domain-containing protein [Loktanella sp. F6476L]|uniref:DKNYY domain-containing protein n=1 Tax=Loktanella sp. F6476L TaxID=2926405 RepID=UPI001FF32CB0|nr:DKNYY domain-containing protein [Loktanella sp. F6476L]MCK0121562.1 DKNYY domain-containing protein [Loktanella sp. F6476L]